MKAICSHGSGQIVCVENSQMHSKPSGQSDVSASCAIGDYSESSPCSRSHSRSPEVPRLHVPCTGRFVILQLWITCNEHVAFLQTAALDMKQAGVAAPPCRSA